MLSDIQFIRTAMCDKYTGLFMPKFHGIPLLHSTVPDDLKCLSSSYFYENGLSAPLFFEDTNAKMNLLKMKLPSADSLEDVADIIGDDFPVKLIEVGTQTEIEGYTIGEFAEYLKKRGESHKVLNMISLEVSSTPLASHILSPRFVRQLDWIDAYWPVDRRARGRDFPSVQKYVLCGMKGSYTDFHVDFGGTSVWYHVLFGQKDFILAPPTMRNFAAYRKWTKSCDQDNIFFSDIIGSENCRRISIRAGQTLLIPGGWIHGVYTPVDSLVVGGNFLLDLCILPQLQTYAVEQDIHVTKKYSFPCFKQMVWYVLCGCLRLIPGLPGSRFPSVQERSPPFTCARVLWQWPYLLKTCADWIQSDSLGRVDAEVISQEALKCGHTTMVAASELSQSIDEKSVGYPMGVIDEWWDIMTRSDRHPVAAPRDCSFGNVSFLEHVSYVRSILSFNALDEPLYATYPVEFATFKTDPYCAADESGQLEESFSYFDGASAAIREDMAAVLPINGDDDRKPGVEHQSQNGSCNVLDSRSLVNIKTDISVDVFGATASSHLSQKIIIPTKRHMNTDVEDHSARKK